MVQDRNGACPRTVGPGMTTIGFIGSGHIGSTLAKLAVDAGYDVVMSNSRGPETLQDLVDELGPRAAPRPPRRRPAGDLVVVTVPLKASVTCPSPRSRARSSSTPATTTRSATARSRSSTTSSTTTSEPSRPTCRSRTWSRPSTTSTSATCHARAPLRRPERSVLTDRRRPRRREEDGHRLPRPDRVRRLRRRAALRGLALPARHPGLRWPLRGPRGGLPGPGPSGSGCRVERALAEAERG